MFLVCLCVHVCLGAVYVVCLCIPGHLQDGWHSYENARRWEHTREENRQDFPTDGQEPGRQTFPGGVYRGRHERPIHCSPPAMWPPVQSELRFLLPFIHFHLTSPNPHPTYNHLPVSHPTVASNELFFNKHRCTHLPMASPSIFLDIQTVTKWCLQGRFTWSTVSRVYTRNRWELTLLLPNFRHPVPPTVSKENKLR